MLSSVKNTAIAAVTSLSLALTAAPALAWGEREQNFLAGLATAVVVGTVINDIKHKNQAARAPQVQRPPVYQPRPTPVYQPSYQSIYATPAARAFNSYSARERMAIQRRLAAYGYYRSGIDGSFGPGTYNAVLAYARDTRGGDLTTTGGAFGIYDGLLY